VHAACVRRPASRPRHRTAAAPARARPPAGHPCGAPVRLFHLAPPDLAAFVEAEEDAAFSARVREALRARQEQERVTNQIMRLRDGNVQAAGLIANAKIVVAGANQLTEKLDNMPKTAMIKNSLTAYIGCPDEYCPVCVCRVPYSDRVFEPMPYPKIVWVGVDERLACIGRSRSKEDVHGLRQMTKWNSETLVRRNAHTS
jgi:hypothetical protein